MLGGQNLLNAAEHVDIYKLSTRKDGQSAQTRKVKGQNSKTTSRAQNWYDDRLGNDDLQQTEGAQILQRAEKGGFRGDGRLIRVGDKDRKCAAKHNTSKTAIYA